MATDADPDARRRRNLDNLAKARAKQEAARLAADAPPDAGAGAVEVAAGVPVAALDAVAAKQDAEVDAGDGDRYPVAYANPRIVDERFRVGDNPNFVQFYGGRFVAHDAQEEAAVRAALAGHGPDKPDRWMGSDTETVLKCPRCSFHTRLWAAYDDHRLVYHTDH